MSAESTTPSTAGQGGAPLPVPRSLAPAAAADAPVPAPSTSDRKPAAAAPAQPKGGDATGLLDPAFIRKLEQMQVASKRIFAGRMKGERRSPRRGQSVEFADFRNYVIGDDLRFVDWNIYARVERLFLKLFLEEEDLNISIILDTSASMAYGEPDKLEYGKRIAAALAYIGLANLDRVNLHTAQDHLGAGLVGMRTKRVAQRVFSFLTSLRGHGATDLTEACKRFSLQHRQKGIAIVISDFLDKRGFEPALKYLLMSGCDVIAIHLLAPDEVDPDLTGDLRLVDLEDGSIAEVSRSDLVIRQYKKTLELFANSLKDACVKRDITYLYAVTDQPFEELVLKTLRRMGVLA